MDVQVSAGRGGVSLFDSHRGKTHTASTRRHNLREKSKDLPDRAFTISSQGQQHCLPFMMQLHPKSKLESSLGLALPRSCSCFMWLQRLLPCSSCFQRAACMHTGTQNTVNECLASRCVCSDTAPLAKGKNCVDVCTYKGFKEDVPGISQLC